MDNASTHQRTRNAAAAGSRATPWSPLDEMFEDVVCRGLLSGAVTLAWHSGSLAHSAAIGWQDVEGKQPMELDAIFRLYSMTKPVTAVAMMILWDEGKWSPDDPIAKFLPELRHLKVVRGLNEEGRPLVGEPASPPLMEHLMTHQVGFSYGFGDDPVDNAFRAAGLPTIPYDMRATDYLARLSHVPLAFHPGSGWRYSVAMDVQGIIVERLSGMGLRQFMKERIFDPLEMVDCDFIVPAEKRNRLASLYTLNGENLIPLPAKGALTYSDTSPELDLNALVIPYDTPPLLPSGGGGLACTAQDYLRFARMLLGRGELEGQRILSPEAVALMTRSHTPQHLLTGEFGTAPHVLRPGYEYAYNGMVINDPQATGVALGRDTYFWDGAAGCWFWVDPTNDVVLVSMIQLLADANLLSLQFRSRDIVAGILDGA